MKLEMDDTTGFTIWGCLVAIIIGCGSLGGCYITEKTKWKAFEAGLVEAEVPGVNVLVWTKPAEPKR